VPDERLQKVLARAGVASRRHAEELISAGRVRVDGRIERELGVRVGSRARIEVDGRVVVAEPLVYLVLHKPRGVVCTLKDPEGRPTVADYLKDVGSRVVPVGRLDFHTSGAIICTNDGELASHLMHPRYHARKEYVAKVGGVVNDAILEKFRERIVIDGRATRPAEVMLLRVEDGKSWLSVKLGEGRNRQVRRLGEHAGLPVMRLARVAHAGITAESLRPGEWRMLTIDELKAMKREYGVPRRIHAPDARIGEMRGGQVTLRQPKARDAKPRHGGAQRDSAPRRDGEDYTAGRRRDGVAPREVRGARGSERRREPAARPDQRNDRRDTRREPAARPGQRNDRRDTRREPTPRPDQRNDRRDTRREPAPRPGQRNEHRDTRRDDAAPRRDARRPEAPGRDRGPSGRGGRGSGHRRGT
jgi:23S rRNA pseudouridine2605 synthase